MTLVWKSYQYFYVVLSMPCLWRFAKGRESRWSCEISGSVSSNYFSSFIVLNVRKKKSIAIDRNMCAQASCFPLDEIRGTGRFEIILFGTQNPCWHKVLHGDIILHFVCSKCIFYHIIVLTLYLPKCVLGKQSICKNWIQVPKQFPLKANIHLVFFFF